MIRTLMLSLAALAVASPALASDLAYRHDRNDGPSLLEGSNGRAYWILLSECAGFYGAMANMATSEADYQADLASGTAWLNLAIDRVRADRGIGRTEALALIEPRAIQARSAGESSIAGGRPVGGGTLTPDQVMRSTCGSLGRVYRAQAG